MVVPLFKIRTLALYWNDLFTGNAINSTILLADLYCILKSSFFFVFFFMYNRISQIYCTTILFSKNKISPQCAVYGKKGPQKPLYLVWPTVAASSRSPPVRTGLKNPAWYFVSVSNMSSIVVACAGSRPRSFSSNGSSKMLYLRDVMSTCRAHKHTRQDGV